MQRFSLVFFYAAVLLSCTFVSADSQAERIRVAVAANFYPVLTDLAERFEADERHRVDLILGSSGKLAAQIIRGAPFDLFLSADVLRPQQLEARGLVVPGSRATYALGRLALLSSASSTYELNPEASPEFSPESSPEYRLKSSDFSKLAMANPKLAPYGRAANQSLAEWNINLREDQRVYGENVSQAFHFVEAGQIDLAFVAYSQVISEQTHESRYSLVPEHLYEPVEQQMVLLTTASAAAEFYDFLLSVESQLYIAEQGYHVINMRQPSKAATHKN